MSSLYYCSILSHTTVPYLATLRVKSHAENPTLSFLRMYHPSTSSICPQIVPFLSYLVTFLTLSLLSLGIFILHTPFPYFPYLVHHFYFAFYFLLQLTLSHLVIFYDLYCAEILHSKSFLRAPHITSSPHNSTSAHELFQHLVYFPSFALRIFLTLCKDSTLQLFLYTPYFSAHTLFLCTLFTKFYVSLFLRTH
jgi:hypothetical protein